MFQQTLEFCKQLADQCELYLYHLRLGRCAGEEFDDLCLMIQDFLNAIPDEELTGHPLNRFFDGLYEIKEDLPEEERPRNEMIAELQTLCESYIRIFH